MCIFLQTTVHSAKSSPITRRQPLKTSLKESEKPFRCWAKALSGSVRIDSALFIGSAHHLSLNEEEFLLITLASIVSKRLFFSSCHLHYLILSWSRW